MLVPHLKQAWRRFLVKELWMDEGSATTAMKIGLLDLLSVIPQEEVIEYGIPFLHSLLEAGKEQKTVALWDKFWAYFHKTWIPILKSWNICIGGEYIKLVNRTNNGLEQYNRKFNGLFRKKPSLIEKAGLKQAVGIEFLADRKSKSIAPNLPF